MPNNKIEIINMGLRALAEQPINALDEGSEPANIMSDIYDAELEAEIREWPYQWAQRTVSLAQVSGETAPDYQYVYQLPADFVSLVELVDTNTGNTVWYYDASYSFINVRYQEWEIREDKLYINSSSITIKYAVMETDTSKWDATFTRAFAYRLAMIAGPSLTEKLQLIDRAERLYIREVAKARANSKNEYRRMNKLSQDYLNVRN